VTGKIQVASDDKRQLTTGNSRRKPLYHRAKYLVYGKAEQIPGWGQVSSNGGVQRRK